MKDLSFFLLKNALGAKMKKGFRNLCSGDDSTSTVNQQRTEQGSTCIGARSMVGSPCLHAATLRESQPTLEEMILQLELEEKAARRAKLDEYGEIRHRMSCVNSSDILRTARNALNQYPRFSLDGKDAMYRSSFRNMVPAMSNPGLRKGFHKNGSDLEVGRIRQLPATLAGENVVWCRPGVVGKLMGLEALPIPVGRYRRSWDRGLTTAMKRQHLRRRKDDERDEIEKRRLGVDTNDWARKDEGVKGSCSTTRYCLMKPVRVDHRSNEEVGWPIRRCQ